jgi:hypothetical protein
VSSGERLPFERAALFAAAVESVPLLALLFFGVDAIGPHGGDAPDWVTVTYFFTHWLGLPLAILALALFGASWLTVLFLSIPLNAALMFVSYLAGAILWRVVSRRGG